MSLFGRLLGSEEAIKGVRDGVDAAFFTNEEKSEWKLRLLKAYEPFRIAQRYLALILSIPFISTHMLAAFIFVISLCFDPCVSQVAKDGELVENTCKAQQLERGAEKLFDKNNETLGTPLALILSFYFAGGAAEGLARTLFKGRKTK